MSTTPDLTIVILNFNTQFWLKKTLTTLKEYFLKHTQFTVKVVVVDNASADDSVKMVKQSFRWVEVIELDQNLGFSAGNNVALKQVKSPYAMLLNSDVEFTEKSNLDPLITYMNDNPKVGVITPRLTLVDGKLDWASHRGEPDLWASFTYLAGLEKLFPNSRRFGQYHKTYQDLNIVHDVEACSGAAMIVRTTAFPKTGLLDEQFFMYAEDLDWCKQFREAGYRVVYHPGAVLIHHKYKSGLNSSASPLKRKTTYHFYDTMLQYYDKHYQDKYPKFVRTIIKYFIDIKKGVA